MTVSDDVPSKKPASEDWVVKVLRQNETLSLMRDGRFQGSVDDLRDGFVHLSTVAQVQGTLRKHFAGETGLFLALCRAAHLGEALRWEPSRNEKLFPHLYRALQIADVTAILPVPEAPEDWTVPVPQTR
jgi:uncharacterized protein (DUF952 family)